jgi:hypothetical protein
MVIDWLFQFISNVRHVKFRLPYLVERGNDASSINLAAVTNYVFSFPVKELETGKQKWGKGK